MAPSRVNPLITRFTAFSFPGINDDANTTVSDGPTEMAWSRLAIRERTAIGSPCDPVQISTALSSGRFARSSADTRVPSGMRRNPRSRAMCMLRTMDRPTKAILRLCSTAMSMICWMRCTCEAKDATITRPLALAKTLSSTGMMSRSLGMNPATSALVESIIKMSTPSSPSRAKPLRSVTRLSSGNWSTLKSPVCRTRPAGVVIDTAMASGMEWVTARNSRPNGPTVTFSRSLTSRSSGLIRCSVNFARRKASVSVLP